LEGREQLTFKHASHFKRKGKFGKRPHQKGQKGKRGGVDQPKIGENGLVF